MAQNIRFDVRKQCIFGVHTMAENVLGFNFRKNRQKWPSHQNWSSERRNHWAISRCFGCQYSWNTASDDNCLRLATMRFSAVSPIGLLHLTRLTSPWLFIAVVRRWMSIRTPRMPPTWTPVSKDAQRQRPSTVDPRDLSSVRPPPLEGGILAATADGRRSLTVVTVALVVATARSRPADIVCHRPHCRLLCYVFRP